MSRYAEVLLALGHGAELEAERTEEFWRFDLGIDPRYDPDADEQDRDAPPGADPLADCAGLRAGGGGGEGSGMTVIGRRTCDRCVGIGLVRDPRPRIVAGALRYLADCPDCRGLGHVTDDNDTAPSVNSGTTPPPEETP